MSLGSEARQPHQEDVPSSTRKTYEYLLRRGKLKALVAVARSILVVVWHLLTDPTIRFRDLGPDFHTRRVNTDRKIRSLVHQLEVLGHTVTLQPAA